MPPKKILNQSGRPILNSTTLHYVSFQSDYFRGKSFISGQSTQHCLSQKKMTKVLILGQTYVENVCLKITIIPPRNLFTNFK